MEDNKKKIQNLLENVIRASKILVKKGYLDVTEGEQMIRCLLGIRQRFLSEGYMNKSPIGQEINEIDEMILPLDKKLVEAGKRGYKNTISYILKTVVQGAGIGHRILTAEEERNKALVLLKRKLKVQDYLDAIENAQKLDEKISSRKFIMKRQQMLREDCQTYEAKIAQIKQTRPDVMEELMFFTDLEDMSADALEYIELTSSLTKAKNDIEEHSEDLNNLEYLIQSYMQVLDFAKRWDEEPSKVKQINENREVAKHNLMDDSDTKIKESEISSQETEVISDKSAINMDDDSITTEKMLEMQKLIEKFVEDDGPSMVDLGYDEMERVFASRELNEYVANSLREFEELELAEESLI